MLADVRFEPFDEGMVVRVSGEVDMSNADEIGRGIAQMLSNEMLALVLDLSEVDYFDSAGIHLIYGLREALRVRGQQLLLVVPTTSPAHDSLRLAAVLQSLGVHEDAAGALAAVESRTS